MCDRHCRGHTDREGHCHPPEGRMRGFVQPWLLLLLAYGASHGYELMERLGKDEEIPDADPGLLYRTLRQFEQDGLVRSAWDTAGGGAARRVYEITAEGLEHLHAWAVNVRRTRQRLDRFLNEYQARFQSSPDQERR
jgi:PadR family transcriptional regulator PadR